MQLLDSLNKMQCYMKTTLPASTEVEYQLKCNEIFQRLYADKLFQP